MGEPRCPLSSDPRLGTVRQAAHLGSAALRSSPAPHRLQMPDSRLQLTAWLHTTLFPHLHHSTLDQRETDLFPSPQPTLYTHDASPLPSSSTRGKLPEEFLKFVAVAPKGRCCRGIFRPKSGSSFTSPLTPGSIHPSPLPAHGEGKGGGEIPGVIGISLFGAVVLPALRGGNGFSYRCLCFLS